jgi:hypothetical protein
LPALRTKCGTKIFVTEQCCDDYVRDRARQIRLRQPVEDQCLYGRWRATRINHAEKV